MPDPLNIFPPGVSAAAGATPALPRADGGENGADALSFASSLREQIEKASALQTDADQKLQSVLTGESQNVTEVLVAARKAQVAFSLLMEIRNKLVDAYQELQNLRV
jgi:flagellar hook-basal body complex protein FliE